MPNGGRHGHVVHLPLRKTHSHVEAANRIHFLRKSTMIVRSTAPVIGWRSQQQLVWSFSDDADEQSQHFNSL
jgi:hypothetical protein